MSLGILQFSCRITHVFCLVETHFLLFFLQANELLLFNKKLTAAEACAQGLVTEVFPDRTFQKEVWARLEAYASLPKNVSILKLSCILKLSPAHKPVAFSIFLPDLSLLGFTSSLVEVTMLNIFSCKHRSVPVPLPLGNRLTLFYPG